MEKYAKMLRQNGDKFKTLAIEMLTSLTPEAFENSYIKMVDFASTSTHPNELNNWVGW